MMRKILTGQTVEEIYSTLENRGHLSDEEKECRKENKATSNKVVKKSRKKPKHERKSVMTWIDYKRLRVIL